MIEMQQISFTDTFKTVHRLFIHTVSRPSHVTIQADNRLAVIGAPFQFKSTIAFGSDIEVNFQIQWTALSGGDSHDTIKRFNSIGIAIFAT